MHILSRHVCRPSLAREHKLRLLRAKLDKQHARRLGKRYRHVRGGGGGSNGGGGSGSACLAAAGSVGFDGGYLYTGVGSDIGLVLDRQNESNGSNGDRSLPFGGNSRGRNGGRPPHGRGGSGSRFDGGCSTGIGHVAMPGAGQQRMNANTREMHSSLSVARHVAKPRELNVPHTHSSLGTGHARGVWAPSASRGVPHNVSRRVETAASHAYIQSQSSEPMADDPRRDSVLVDSFLSDCGPTAATTGDNDGKAPVPTVEHRSMNIPPLDSTAGNLRVQERNAQNSLQRNVSLPERSHAKRRRPVRSADSSRNDSSHQQRAANFGWSFSQQQRHNASDATRPRSQEHKTAAASSPVLRNEAAADSSLPMRDKAAADSSPPMRDKAAASAPALRDDEAADSSLPMRDEAAADSSLPMRDKAAVDSALPMRDEVGDSHTASLRDDEVADSSADQPTIALEDEEDREADQSANEPVRSRHRVSFWSCCVSLSVMRIF